MGVDNSFSQVGSWDVQEGNDRIVLQNDDPSGVRMDGFKIMVMVPSEKKVGMELWHGVGWRIRV